MDTFPKNVRFQFKGKRHIKYCNEKATRIWVINDFKIPWETCLTESLRQHREYLKFGKYDPPNLSRWNNDQEV